MNQILENNPSQNVHGWERTASLVGGLILLGEGFRRGGVGGWLQLGVGGMALVRGMTGRCELKRILTETPVRLASADPIQRYAHMPLDSEVRSPDFEDADTTLPDTTPMGHEAHPEARGPASTV